MTDGGARSLRTTDKVAVGLLIVWLGTPCLAFVAASAAYAFGGAHQDPDIASPFEFGTVVAMIAGLCLSAIVLPTLALISGLRLRQHSRITR